MAKKTNLVGVRACINKESNTFGLLNRYQQAAQNIITKGR